MADYTKTVRVTINGVGNTFVFTEKRSGSKRGLTVKRNGQVEWEYMADVNLNSYHCDVTKFYDGLMQAILDQYQANNGYPAQIAYLRYTFE